MKKELIERYIEVAKKYFSCYDGALKRLELMLEVRKEFGDDNFDEVDIIEALAVFSKKKGITTETIFTVLDILGVDYD